MEIPNRAIQMKHAMRRMTNDQPWQTIQPITISASYSGVLPTVINLSRVQKVKISLQQNTKCKTESHRLSHNISKMTGKVKNDSVLYRAQYEHSAHGVTLTYNTNQSSIIRQVRVDTASRHHCLSKSIVEEKRSYDNDLCQENDNINI